MFVRSTYEAFEDLILLILVATISFGLGLVVNDLFTLRDVQDGELVIEDTTYQCTVASTS